ncbi:MAG: Na/Pi cotransporter family protein [Ruminococcaceae bacterium]|nr:Na/Pi cotransporter family protein [Oscillospiraceae bacterium]
MDFTNVLALIGGVALFLFGMSIMGDALEKSAGSKLSSLLDKLSSNPLKGFVLGAIVTAIIQSSSATTVMLVGFVNSGVMTLANAIPVIMGANVGTTITAWILSLSGIDGESFLMTMLKPTSFTPILAVIGIVFYLFLKDSKKKDIGLILLGFSVLIFGMDYMTAAVKPLADVPEFQEIMLLFSNPILGMLAGALLTAIIQSSTASVGILQALSATGRVTFATAFPIILGQNIGTCVTAIISSVGANKNAKRVSVVHLCFNIIGAVLVMIVFYLLHFIIGFAFVDSLVDHTVIALVHTCFNVFCTFALLPFCKQFEKLACFLVKDKKDGDEKFALLDERLLATPSIAIERCRQIAVNMADISFRSVKKSITLLENYDKKLFEEIQKEEDSVDIYEDEIGSYLMKITNKDLSEKDSSEVTKLFHMIGNLERLSDHAVNVAESAQEMHEKKLEFSEVAKKDLSVMITAVHEIMDNALMAFVYNDVQVAVRVEPLEEVIDDLQAALRAGHIERLRNGECTIELGFILSDLLTNLERIADHCSNVAGCVIEIANNSLGMHSYTEGLRRGNAVYDQYFEDYSKKYRLNT